MKTKPREIKLVKLLVALSILGVIVSCTQRPNPLPKELFVHTNAPGLLTAEEAAKTPFRYAYSGQVLSDLTGEPIPDFSVSIADSDPQVTAIINALGETNGVFHISRTGSDSTTLPVVVTAPGFEPAVQLIDIGSDCKGTSCTGSEPSPIELKPLAAENAVPTALPTANIPMALSNEISAKVDPALWALLNQKKPDPINDVLVMLNNSNPSAAESAVPNILGSVKGQKLAGLIKLGAGLTSAMLPIVAATNPQMGAALGAVNLLLPYVQSMTQNFANGQGGLLGNALSAFLNPSALAGLQNQFSLTPNKPGLQMAFATFVPLMNAFSGGSYQGAQNPFAALLSNVLKQPNLQNVLASFTNPATSTGNQGVALALTYLQPLIQGLAGKDSGQLSTLFNSLVQSQGLLGIKNLSETLKNSPNQDVLSQLLPYLEPLMKGLNGSDNPTLVKTLTPLMAQKDPALALRNLITNESKSQSTGKMALVASTLFPAFQQLVSGVVPSKQIFTAQILSGLLNGGFQNGLQVVRDLKGTSGVVMSGQAKDIQKIAALPNVARILPLIGLRK